SLILRDRTLRRALDAVPPAQRSFRVDLFGLTFSLPPNAGRAAGAGLGVLTRRRPVPAVTYRKLRLQEHLVLLSAVGDLRRWLELRSGRLPRSCRPERCEVLVVGKRRLPPELTTPGLTIVPVGRASLRVPAVLGDFARPSE